MQHALRFAIAAILIAAATTCAAGPPVAANSTIAFGGGRWLDICPKGDGETLAQGGNTITVVLNDANNQPCAGIPAADIQLRSQILVICPNGANADGPSSNQGIAQWTGALKAGGCALHVEVWASGVFIGNVPLRAHSPDGAGGAPTGDGIVDASDLSAFAALLGRGPNDCWDFNEDGNVDASDLAYFAAHFRHRCP